jgi:hypothetical protein
MMSPSRPLNAGSLWDKIMQAHPPERCSMRETPSLAVQDRSLSSKTFFGN